MSAKRSHLVVTVHGIRTYGHWQERLEELVVAEVVDRGDVEFVNYKFGYFSAISFAIPLLRWLLVRRFRAELLRLCAANPRLRIDLVGHSFGTHVIAWAVAGLPADSKVFINTIILSGSVLRSAFPWHEYIGSRVGRVVNDCGSKDAVLLMSQFLVFFTGMAGRIGFGGATGEQFRNRYSSFGHSGYFLDDAGKPNDEYLRRHWVPLLTSERPAPAFDFRVQPTILDSFTERLATHAGLIKLAVYLTPFVILSAVYFTLYQNAERARVQAEVARSQAESARNSLASQLAATYHTSSQNAAEQEKNLQAGFTFAVKAAQTSPPDDEKLGMYLDRLVHLARRMPNRIVNLPIAGGVNMASFDSALGQLAIVTDDLNVSVFGLPGIEPLFVPESINKFRNRAGYAPTFSDDATRLETQLNWNHPDPDPDNPGAFYLQAAWNPKTNEVYLPEDNGSISPDDLKWTFEASAASPAEPLPPPPPKAPASKKKADKKRTAGPASKRAKNAKQRPAPAAAATKQAAAEPETPDEPAKPTVYDKLMPSKAIGKNASIVLTVDSTGVLMQWALPALEQSPAATLLSPGQKWIAAKAVGERLLAIDGDNKTLSAWDVRAQQRLWSNTIDSFRSVGRSEIFRLSPDDQLALVNQKVFRVSDGKEIASASGNDLRNIDDVTAGALTSTGSMKFAGTFDTGNGDALVFEDIPNAQGRASPPAAANTGISGFKEAVVKPHEFIQFLRNGRYYLYGSSGSVSIAELPSDRLGSNQGGMELVRFYFGGVSRLSDMLGRALLRDVVEIDIAASEATLRLAGGAALKVTRSPDSGAGDMRASNGGFPITRPKFGEVGERDIVALSADARWLAVAGEKFVRVWDAATGHPLTEKVEIPGTALDVAFDRGGKRIRVATTEGHLLELQARFAWTGKPAWLDGFAEGVTAQTLMDDGTFSRLTAAQTDAARNKFLGELGKAEPADPVKLLRAHFGVPPQ